MLEDMLESDIDMVDPQEIHEEHREYLDIKDNPKKVTSGAIFKLVSDGLVDLKAEVVSRIAVLETKHDSTHQQITKMDVKIEKVTNELDMEQRKIRADFEAECTTSAKRNGTFEERFKWQAKTQKLIITFLVSILGFLLWAVGIPLPIP